MKDFPAELMYVLMFLVVMLYQYLMKRFGPPEQPEVLPQEGLQDIPEAEWEAQPPGTWNTLSASQFGKPEGPVVAPEVQLARVQRRFGRTALMGTRHDVQNAFVIATILGPCRAFEQHDVK